MISVDCLNDLQPFGINPLTGEADNLMYRMLCDITCNGYKLMCEVLGLRYQPPSWYKDAHKARSDEETQGACLVGTPYSRPWWGEHTTPPGWAHNWNPGEQGQIYRRWKCSCGHEWQHEVDHGKVGQIVVHGERPVHCPKCNGANGASLQGSPHMERAADPHVASIMLAHDAWQWIAPIALLNAGCHIVLLREFEMGNGMGDGGTYTMRRILGLQGDDKYYPAPYDFEAGKYTGPAMLELGTYNRKLDGKILRTWSYDSHPRKGSRNVHQATGRTV